MSTGSDDPRIDDVARSELAAEAERHRAALGALTTRDGVAAAAEVDHHLDRVEEIMRDFVRRTPPG